MRRIAIINQKGGVGKTTTTVNVGMGLARAGYRVLLIDLDPQAHLSLHLGVDPAAGRPGVYELLTGSGSIAKARAKAGNNLWLVSSSIDLAAAEVELGNAPGRETILRDLLDQHIRSTGFQSVNGHQGTSRGPYDYVLMDCPPSLNVLTINALCAAGEVLIPLQPHYLALQGLGKLLETVALVSKGINPSLQVTGVVMCLHDAGTRLGAEVIEDVRQFFENDRGKPVPWAGARVFDTIIRRNIKLAESPSYGQSIYDYAPDSNGAKDYEQLVRELSGATAVQTTGGEAEAGAGSVSGVAAATVDQVEATETIPQAATPAESAPEAVKATETAVEAAFATSAEPPAEDPPLTVVTPDTAATPADTHDHAEAAERRKMTA